MTNETTDISLNHDETNTAVNALQMYMNLRDTDTLTSYVDALTASRDAFGGFYVEASQKDAQELTTAMRYAARRGVYNRQEALEVFAVADKIEA